MPLSHNAQNKILEQQIRREFNAEYAPAAQDPFAAKLSDLVGGGGPVPNSRGKKSSHTGSRLSGSQLAGSQLSKRSGGGSQLAGSQLAGSQLAGSRLAGSQLSGRGGGSQLSAVRSQQSGAGGDDMRSEISGVTSLSWRTPSTIRSSEPSEIARNKIAELQLRLELERVLRLQRETELEDQRRKTAVEDSKKVRHERPAGSTLAVPGPRGSSQPPIG